MNDDKKLNNEEKILQERLQKDFIVRNMPTFNSLSSVSYKDKEEKKTVYHHTNKNNDNQKNNKHQSIGIIIISIGVLIIAGLFYSAYRFLILPTIQPTIKSAKTNNINNNTNNINNANNIVTTTESLILQEEPEIIPTSTETIAVVEKPEELIVNNIKVNNNTLSLPSLPLVNDSDNDGLSDVSELFLGTNPQLTDTDSDSYNDRQEIISGYNPLGAGKLSETKKFSLYIDPNNFFLVLYPQNWIVNAINQDSILFTSPDQSFIQIAKKEVEQNYNNILDWYSNQFSDAYSLDSSRFLEGNMGVGIISADGQMVYFLDPKKSYIFVVSYVKSSEEAVSYLDSFKMMATTLMTP